MEDLEVEIQAYVDHETGVETPTEKEKTKIIFLI